MRRAAREVEPFPQRFSVFKEPLESFRARMLDSISGTAHVDVIVFAKKVHITRPLSRDVTEEFFLRA